MRLVIAVVQDQDSQKLSDHLVERGFRATKLASTGGFLKAGNTTFLIGVDQTQVEDVMGVIRESCQAREQMLNPMNPLGNGVEPMVPYPVKVQVGGATVFVLDVETFAHF
ncbi:cyclic-di-AMP receptor [Tumebacillus sp. ITR2]|uniref:Cyclic-di-AMP receptor n=1 Tax=Tumebacillus amylolyticus TaxID=2801339 RepID=A0ABS1JFK1_9BACL|nr:cyclic-di-AMP receptor [Tumebacillus amylolyticus]MBL0389039.1 cyclic-di-AMP receptor [Tumebacillus amylolyticus]